MHPKLSVLVQVDLDGRHLTLAVTGTLTETNQQALPPLVHRVRGAFPHAQLTVDLHQAHLAEATAIELLISSLQGQAPGNGPAGRGSVRITTPAPLDQDAPSPRGPGLPAGHGPRRSTMGRFHPTTVSSALPRHHTDGAPRGGQR